MDISFLYSMCNFRLPAILPPAKFSMRNKGESADLLNCMLKHSRTSVGLFQMKEHREKKKAKTERNFRNNIAKGIGLKSNGLPLCHSINPPSADKK